MKIIEMQTIMYKIANLRCIILLVILLAHLGSLTLGRIEPLYPHMRVYNYLKYFETEKEFKWATRLNDDSLPSDVICRQIRSFQDETCYSTKIFNALCLIEGCCINRDLDKGLNQLEEISHEHDIAKFILAQALVRSHKVDEGIILYKQLADNGNLLSQERLAMIYYARDTNLFLKYAFTAANNGSVYVTEKLISIFSGRRPLYWKPREKIIMVDIFIMYNYWSSRLKTLEN